MSVQLKFWWLGLCGIAVLNVLSWIASRESLANRRASLTPELYAARRLQLMLSAVYVFGCAFRSVFPVYDVPRLCLSDTWLSSVLVGRSVATCAELCFVAQWAVMMRESARATGSALSRLAALVVVPLIGIAETCSWYSVLTTSNGGHVIEESLWGFSATLLIVSIASSLPRCTASRRPLLMTWCFAGAAYAAYMFLVDVPMYWHRWVGDTANGRQYLGIAQGFIDVSRHWVVGRQWRQWHTEVLWMSLYFSVGVWFSISLIHAPALIPRRRSAVSPPLRAIADTIDSRATTT